MGKHLSFWIGFFAAALIIVPVAVGVWGAAGDLAEFVAVFLFGVIVALVGVLFVVLLFRDAILRRLLGRSEATLQDVSGGLVRTVSAASAGDRASAEAEAVRLGQTLAGWYAWSNLYRWVIASALGFLLAFGAFTGTVLLFEQNRKLGEQTETLRTQTAALETQTERLTEQTGFMRSQTNLMQAQTDRLQEQTDQAAMQNEILTLSLVGEIRNQLLSTIEVDTLEKWLTQNGISNLDKHLFMQRDSGCGIRLSTEHSLSRPPSRSTRDAVQYLAQRGLLKDEVLRALEFLTRDDNGAVAFGAIQVLGAVGALAADGAPYRVRNVYVDQVQILGAPHIRFSQSYVANLDCEGCQISFERSFGLAVRAQNVSGFESVTVGSFRSSPDLEGIRIVFGDEPSEDEWPNTPLDVGPWFGGSEFVAYLTGTDPEDACRILDAFGRTNPMLTRIR